MRFQVWNRETLESVQTIAVVPIATGNVQKELMKTYFSLFQQAFSGTFGNTRRIVSQDAVQNRIAMAASQDQDFTWEFMAEIGKQLQADAIAGLLIEEGGDPGTLIEHIKIVSVNNGKILASDNFLFRESSRYDFKQEMSELRKILVQNKRRIREDKNQ